jgi:hypothetical protein
MDGTDLVWLDATSLAGLVSTGEVTAVEVVQAHLDRIDRVGGRVNALVTVLGEQALEAARRPHPGPLRGVPFTVKDSFDTAAVRLAADDVIEPPQFVGALPDRVRQSDADPTPRAHLAQLRRFGSAPEDGGVSSSPTC